MGKPQIIFLTVSLLCRGCLFLKACKWSKRGHGLVADSAGRWFGLPTASQGLEGVT